MQHGCSGKATKSTSKTLPELKGLVGAAGHEPNGLILLQGSQSPECMITHLVTDANLFHRIGGTRTHSVTSTKCNSEKQRCISNSAPLQACRMCRATFLWFCWDRESQLPICPRASACKNPAQSQMQQRCSKITSSRRSTWLQYRLLVVQAESDLFTAI